MKNYYATGNGGNGTGIFAFGSKKERDEFVGFNAKFDQKSAVTRKEAKKYSSTAIVMENGRFVEDGTGPKIVEL